jgi:hypothetical protein
MLNGARKRRFQKPGSGTSSLLPISSGSRQTPPSTGGLPGGMSGSSGVPWKRLATCGVNATRSPTSKSRYFRDNSRPGMSPRRYVKPGVRVRKPDSKPFYSEVSVSLAGPLTEVAVRFLTDTRRIGLRCCPCDGERATDQSAIVTKPVAPRTSIYRIPVMSVIVRVSHSRSSPGCDSMGGETGQPARRRAACGL